MGLGTLVVNSEKERAFKLFITMVSAVAQETNHFQAFFCPSSTVAKGWDGQSLRKTSMSTNSDRRQTNHRCTILQQKT